jgi:hypothetical protein
MTRQRSGSSRKGCFPPPQGLSACDSVITGSTSQRRTEIHVTLQRYGRVSKQAEKIWHKAAFRPYLPKQRLVLPVTSCGSTGGCGSGPWVRPFLPPRRLPEAQTTTTFVPGGELPKSARGGSFQGPLPKLRLRGIVKLRSLVTAAPVRTCRVRRRRDESCALRECAGASTHSATLVAGGVAPGKALLWQDVVQCATTTP